MSAKEPDASGIKGTTCSTAWITDEGIPAPIDRFIMREYSVEHYKWMAVHVQQILQEKLDEGGVKQFKLSSRAKDKKSLKEKLVVRNQQKLYKDGDDIRNDVVDLAGVRVILYMPTKEEYNKVEKVIQEIWGKEIKPKTHPEEESKDALASTKHPDEDSKRKGKKNKYQRRHLGYRAIHYQIPMKDSRGSEEYEPMPDDIVEIQVVSALTHVWAEVGHDILYKSHAHGPPTLQEERILDALNGLVHSGDLLLEQFQDMVNKRTMARFKYRAELTIFFREFYITELEALEDPDEYEDPTHARSEGIYILFKFLKKQDMDYPMAVRKVLKELKYPYGFDQTEQAITQTFKNKPQLAANMSMVICLVQRLLRDQEYQPPQTNLSAREQCSIMMSAMTTLQYSLDGGSTAANVYLQAASLNEDQAKSINFVLDSPKRYATLEGQGSEEVVKPSLQDAWTWLRTEASDQSSFCGLLFRLAEMGCRKEADTPTQLDQLQIGPLSRSSTMTVDK
ncbi:hypothetical protein GQ44DRAFT_816387 [Phaeosphaeriaceae sp. PMI808]|nr:hypothetical protein GQ44DRAFT_816387 [Phaeosphaeriaceae sp. PMI808]